MSCLGQLKLFFLRDERNGWSCSIIIPCLKNLSQNWMVIVNKYSLTALIRYCRHVRKVHARLYDNLRSYVEVVEDIY